MKTLLTVISLLLASVTNAQTDWWCVQPAAKSYFINDYSYLRGIRIDSARTAGSNTVLYPFKSARGYYFGNQKLKPSGSWLGETITIAPGGTHYFDNFWGDTVIIKTLADLNDSWELYNDTTALHYTATVTTANIATVLGVQDSVKEITITAWDGAAVNSTDPLHNTTVILSKKHGFVRVPDLFIFPMHEPDRPFQRGFDYWLDRDVPNQATPTGSQLYFDLISFHNPDLPEIYNFNIGDVFEYKADGIENVTGSGIEKLILDEIVEKTAGPAAIQYKIARWVYTQNHTKFPPTHSTVPSFVNVNYNTDLLLDTTYMPEEWGQKDLLRYNPSDTSFCESGPVYERFSNNIKADSTVATFPEACGYGYRYKTKAGRTWYHTCWEQAFGGQYLMQLVYTRKNGNPCGNFYTLDIGQATIKSEIEIYPNPASTRMIVNLPAPAGTATITLYNPMGQQVKQIQTKESPVSVDVSELAGGVYYISISHNGELTNSKILIGH